MPHITINQFSCRYLHQKQPAYAPCVVFLNGIMSPLESWQAQAEMVQKMGFSTLQYDYRGQWYSQVTPGPYTMQTHVDDLLALLQTLEIEQAHFVGTSYGGMASMKFASQFPERVLSQLLIATTAHIRPLPRAILANWQNLTEKNDIEGLFRTFVPDLYSETFQNQNSGLIAQRLTSFQATLIDLPDFCAGQTLLNQAQFPELSDGSLLEKLKGIRCPTLIVAAEEDRLYPPSDSAAIVNRINHARSVTLPGTGHAAVVEQPQLINLILAGHLTTTR